MAYDPHLKILRQSVKEWLQNYQIAIILAIIFILIIPQWLRWSLFYIGSVMLLTTEIANAVNNWKPRKMIIPNGKSVFITGCDTGFGHMLAKELDKEGFEVFAGCLFPDGDGAKELKKSTSNSVHVIPLDVTSDDSIFKAYKYVARNLNEKGLWAVVNNAGINDGGELLWTKMDVIEKVLQVNTLGVIKVTKMFLTLLCQSKGRLVTVASMGGRKALPLMAPYCASKYAVIGFCESLRQEMHPFGVKVVTVEPFGYRTVLADETKVTADLQRAWDSASPEVKDLYPKDYFETVKSKPLKFNKLFVSDNFRDIINCLKEAIMAENPKSSYRSGKLLAFALFFFMDNIPQSFKDFILLTK